MAMDNTPPRNRLIALYTALAVATLLMLKPAFDAYYDRMVVGATQAHLDQETYLAYAVHTPSDEVRERVQDAVVGISAQIERCYDQQRSETPDDEVQGALAYMLATNAQGGVDVTDAEARSPIGQQAMADCVRERVRSLRVEGEGRWRAQLVLGFGRTSAVANRYLWESSPDRSDRLSGAIASLATRGRTAFPQIRPEVGAQMDLAPLQGWLQLPQELPPNVRPPAPPQEPPPTEAVPAEGAPAEGAPAEGAPAEEMPTEPVEAPQEAPAPQPAPEQGAETAPPQRRPAPAQGEAPAPAQRRAAAAEGEEPAPRPRRPAAAEGEEPAPRPARRRPAAEEERPAVQEAPSGGE